MMKSYERSVVEQTDETWSQEFSTKMANLILNSSNSSPEEFHNNMDNQECLSNLHRARRNTNNSHSQISPSSILLSILKVNMVCLLSNNMARLHNNSQVHRWEERR